MALKTYDPKQISVIVGGAIISGFADGEFVTTERNEDAFTLNVGADGEGGRVKSNNKSGRITLTLQQTSDSNLVLSGYAQADELRNAGVVPALIKDLKGDTLISAARAWVVKVPATPYAKDMQTRSWVIETDELIPVVGGNSQ